MLMFETERKSKIQNQFWRRRLWLDRTRLRDSGDCRKRKCAARRPLRLDGVNYEAIAPNDASIFRTTDFDEFLAAANLDAVYIATPNDSHRFLTEKSAAAGKHVLCEKPMATRFEDALRMTEVCVSFGI
jgi:hypothetical protein